MEKSCGARAGAAPPTTGARRPPARSPSSAAGRPPASGRKPTGGGPASRHGLLAQLGTSTRMSARAAQVGEQLLRLVRRRARPRAGRAIASETSASGRPPTRPHARRTRPRPRRGRRAPAQPGLEVALDPQRPRARMACRSSSATSISARKAGRSLGSGNSALEARQLRLRLWRWPPRRPGAAPPRRPPATGRRTSRGRPGSARPVERGEGRLDPPCDTSAIRASSVSRVSVMTRASRSPGSAPPPPPRRPSGLRRLGGATRKGGGRAPASGQGKGDPPSGSQAGRLHGGNCSRTHPSGREPTLTAGAGALAFPRARARPVRHPRRDPGRHHRRDQEGLPEAGEASTTPT